MPGLQIATAMVLPLTILALRVSKTVIQSMPGEILGPGVMLYTSFFILSVFCIISGGLFAAGSRLYAAAIGSSTAVSTGSVYLYEAAGSGIGGILASLVLIRFLTAFEIASLLSILNLVAALTLIGVSLRRLVIIGTIITLFPFANQALESFSLHYLWQGFQMVETRNSIYGNLAVIKTGETVAPNGSFSLFENGLIIYNIPDPEAAEEAVHYALLQHPSPKRLLLVGGGVGGGLNQALKHPTLEHVDYVELDPTILELARRHFPEKWDKRVSVYHIDGRLFLKRSTGMYDVIIVNLPDPHTAQLNRFYTADFFQEAARKLSPDGLLSFQVTGAENYISDELAKFLRCINKTLQTVFPEVIVMPGATIHFFASTQAGILTDDSNRLVERLQQRQIHTSYVREYYIPFRMMPDRMLDLQSHIEPRPETPINRDFVPIAYYFDVALWSTRFHTPYRRMFGFIATLKFEKMMGAAALILFVLVGLLGWTLRNESRHRVTAGFAVFTMGFTLIGLEIMLLLAFQAIYGYVYHQLAIMIGAFMVGMASGSWFSLRDVRDKLHHLSGLQALAALMPVSLYGIFVLCDGIHQTLGLFIVSQILFPALALIAGALGGYQFPLASRIYFKLLKHPHQSPGTLYGLDLIGACLGAVTLSSYLIPVFGFMKTALFLALLNLALAALTALSKHDPTM